MRNPFNLPDDQLQEFHELLADSGLTSDAITYLVHHPHLVPVWMESLTQALESGDHTLTPIDDVFDARICHTLHRHADIATLGELVKWSADELLLLRTLGPKTLDRIERVLEAHGLKLSKQGNGFGTLVMDE